MAHIYHSEGCLVFAGLLDHITVVKGVNLFVPYRGFLPYIFMCRLRDKKNKRNVWLSLHLNLNKWLGFVSSCIVV